MKVKHQIDILFGFDLFNVKRGFECEKRVFNVKRWDKKLLSEFEQMNQFVGSLIVCQPSVHQYTPWENMVLGVSVAFFFCIIEIHSANADYFAVYM